jgi:isopentenyl diphosphate isomerase/L-lactate dehydrogenase-like FMN-dependent dehydrogenase
MLPHRSRQLSRRLFFRHLSASPLVAGWAATSSVSGADKLITAPQEAINIFDLEAVARRTLSPAHWAYLETGVDDDLTVKENIQGFRHFQIRPRPFADVSRIDTAVELFGQKFASPILLAPVGNQRAFHEEADLASARAARVRGHQFILSTYASYHVSDVAKAFGGPLWFQLYPTDDWDVTVQLIRRAEDAGSSVLILTVDTPAGSNRETMRRGGNQASQECRVCHQPGLQAFLKRHPIYRDIDSSRVRSGVRAYTWEFVDRVRQATRLKFLVKGVVTGEDAADCVRHGIDGIIVSNHGGRQLESLLSTIEALPEVVQAAAGKIPVLVDGGVRRGTDVFKALALGAKAVAIGRPYLWGLAAFGQPGVERVLELMQAELVQVMRLAGTPAIRDIGPGFVRRRSAWEE